MDDDCDNDVLWMLFCNSEAWVDSPLSIVGRVAVEADVEVAVAVAVAVATFNKSTWYTLKSIHGPNPKRTLSSTWLDFMICVGQLLLTSGVPNLPMCRVVNCDRLKIYNIDIMRWG